MWGRSKWGTRRWGQGPPLRPVVTGFTYVGPIAAGEVLVINCKAKTVELDGVNVIHNWSGSFPDLLAGLNTLVYDDGEGARALSIQVAWQDKWL